MGRKSKVQKELEADQCLVCDEVVDSSDFVVTNTRPNRLEIGGVQFVAGEEVTITEQMMEAVRFSSQVRRALEIGVLKVV